MLVHVRINVPEAQADEVCAILADNDTVTNLVRLRGASLEPKGDLIEADVAREVASDLLEAFDSIHLGQHAGVVLSPLTATPFDKAHELEEAALGDPDDAVIWDVIKEQATNAVRPTVSFHLFLLIAVFLASIAVVTDSAVLVVGAMVVGPEFATIAAICTGIIFWRPHLILAGVRLLVFAFLFAITIVTVVSWLAVRLGWVTGEIVTRPRPQTGFIWHPDLWSFLVALLAGAAGVIALSVEKSQTMVGVFISVTTVPAAGNLALGIATGSLGEIRGSSAQLAVNIFGMIVAGTLTLLAQKLLWRKVDRLTEPLFRPNRRRPFRP
ncbi:DUF389 domain-containing protein [Calidifontibacter sp. DB0510]|uniref:DUF389 domain-containing protein n=1 Tax=Metallococcus carri TaxID=1656884 RepID=A0A967B3T9_9MICO|nr:DUF389 domain-containing protein [Metallococcus carri]NHN55122.1 DUF389 domain-containing protein [Metallococcus carri]NOP36199.1 DUF389 domain-containing protein [Calidifontibacter sp. DB2511S]